MATLAIEAIVSSATCQHYCDAEDARLWVLRGKLIITRPAGSPYDDIDAVQSFERAIALDPECVEAYQELGDYHDGILDDPDGAMTFYLKAEEIRGKFGSSA